MKRNLISGGTTCFLLLMTVFVVIARNSSGSVSGNWSIMIHGSDSILNEQWTLKQVGKKVGGTAKTSRGGLPLTATIDGKVLRGNIKDGEMFYAINVTISGNEMDGTIQMDKNLFLLSGKRK